MSGPNLKVLEQAAPSVARKFTTLANYANQVIFVIGGLKASSSRPTCIAKTEYFNIRTGKWKLAPGLIVPRY